jgi:prevent-host-death family protein
MAEHRPTTQTINVTEARQKWSQVLNQVFRSKTRVVLEKSGIPLAAIISVQDLERFNRLQAQRAERFEILDRIGEAFKHETPEESERLAARAVAEARAAHRKAQAAAKP